MCIKSFSFCSIFNTLALTSAEGLDWNRVNFFHLDEYYGIDAEDKGSFRYYLRERVEKVLERGHFQYIQGKTTHPEAECTRITQLLKAQPLDLCFLGVGENGHLAFNEPGVADFHDDHWVKLVNLSPLNRLSQVNSGDFLTLEAVPFSAFTLTIPAIFSASKILCLAPKASKAAIIRQMLNEPITDAIPASLLRRHPDAELFLTLDSASLLNIKNKC